MFEFIPDNRIMKKLDLYQNRENIHKIKQLCYVINSAAGNF